MYFIKSPLLLKWFYPALLWNKSRSEKIVYLTFDDGPIPNVTDFVLNTLKTFGVKATFFCIGDNILKHPEQFNRIKNEGHSIGNHTFNHLNGWQTSNHTYLTNFLKCQVLTQTLLFRPPYGRIKKSQAKSVQAFMLNQEQDPAGQSIPQLQVRDLKLPPNDSQLKIVMWDVLSGDFDTTITPEKCYQNVIKHTKNGSIIVFHDSLKAFDRLKYALPETLKYLTLKGYQFGRL